MTGQTVIKCLTNMFGGKLKSEWRHINVRGNFLLYLQYLRFSKTIKYHKRKRKQQCLYVTIRELSLEDTQGFKEMMRMGPYQDWERISEEWMLCAFWLVQYLSQSFSHAHVRHNNVWNPAKRSNICWIVKMLHEMFDRDQTLSNIFSNINVGPTWGDKRSNNVVSNKVR